MAEGRSVGVDVAAGRRGRPDGAGGKFVCGAGGRGRGEIVVLGVCGKGRHAAGDVHPWGTERDASGDGDVDGCVVVPGNADGGVWWGLAVEFEDQLEEREADVAAGGVAGEDYLGGGDGAVWGAWGWGEEGEIGYKGVEEGGWEGILRCEAVAHGEDTAGGELGEFGGHGAVGGRVHEAVGWRMSRWSRGRG